MILEEKIKSLIAEAFHKLFDAELTVKDIKLQPTRREFKGSHTFVVFPYLKVIKRKPEEGADLLGKYLMENSGIFSAYNVVKGFLNLEMNAGSWVEAFYDIAQTPNYGFFPENGRRVIIEYSSPNTNKPLHLGHLRNNFLGYAVAGILKANGYGVSKLNLINDRGIHICKSMLAYQRFGSGETPESSGIKGDHLIGKYYVKFDEEYKKEIVRLKAGGATDDEAKNQAPILKEAQEMLKKWEEGDPNVVSLWKTMNGWVYIGFEETYRNIGIDFDKYYYESETYLHGKSIVEEGLSKGVFFRKEDGSVWTDLTDEGLDEKLLLRADGTSVYMTQDLGAAELKYADFKYDKSVYVVGNEQDYHFDVLFKILKKLGKPYAEGMYHLSYGMVDLPSGKMKSREGTVVDADDLVAEMLETAKRHTRELGKIESLTEEEANELYEIIGLGALKYYLLKVDPKKRMLFNPEESIQFQGFTGPFIQYTHARISAILRKAEETDVEYRQSLTANELNELNETEKDTIFQLGNFQDQVKDAGELYDPSVLAQYIYDLAKEYNRFYAESPIFAEEDANKMKFRVALSYEVAKAIRNGLSMLGIRAPERM